MASNTILKDPSNSVDLSDPSVFDQGIPHELFAELRARPGLTWTQDNDDRLGFWSVTRFDDLVEASRDSETFSSALGHIMLWDLDEEALEKRRSMIETDGAYHTRLRRLVGPAFTPRRIKGYEEAITKRATMLLDAFLVKGGGDWVSEVSAPLPIGVLCEILGLPAEDHGLLVELSDHLVEGTSGVELAPDAYGNTTDLALLPFNSPAAHALFEYARKIGDERRENPTDDLVSVMVNAVIDGDQLTDVEYTNFFQLMIFAGNETTRTSMSHLAQALCINPDLLDGVHDNPDRIAVITEELLRWGSPVLHFRRTATCDTELGGTKIAAGEKVVLWYASANYDESTFENPFSFDADREAQPNLAFGGGGAHFCLGAFLARLELKILITEISRRGIKFELDGDPVLVDSNFVNGVEKLQVKVTTT